jgi:hypothetical protein
MQIHLPSTLVALLVDTDAPLAPTLLALRRFLHVVVFVQACTCSESWNVVS